MLLSEETGGIADHYIIVTESRSDIKGCIVHMSQIGTPNAMQCNAIRFPETLEIPRFS